MMMLPSLLLLLTFASAFSDAFIYATITTTNPLKIRVSQLIQRRFYRPMIGLRIIAPGRSNNSLVVSRGASTTALHATSRQLGGIEIGVQTAQLLMNPKKHVLLKRDISKKYPFVPAAAIDSCINIVATAFRTVAPATLKQALRPGGMEKVRPVLKDAVVSAVLQQNAVKNSPILSNSEKASLVASLVDLALNELLRDSEYLLQRPEVRLEALEEEIRMIQKTEMTTTQLARYRFRKHPVRWSVAILAASFYGYVHVAHAGSYKAAIIALQQGVLMSVRVLARAGQRIYAASIKQIRDLWTKANKFLMAR